MLKFGKLIVEWFIDRTPSETHAVGSPRPAEVRVPLRAVLHGHGTVYRGDTVHVHRFLQLVKKPSFDKGWDSC